MCLRPSLPRDQWEPLIPGDVFQCYKMLRKQGDKLVSPHYTHKVWSATEMVASGQSRNNGDSGIYCFLVKPGPHVVLSKSEQKYGGDRLVRFTVRKEDVIAAGPDTWDGYVGMTIVCKKVTLSEADHADALDDKLQQVLVDTVLIAAKKEVTKIKKAVKAKKAGTKASAATVRKAARQKSKLASQYPQDSLGQQKRPVLEMIAKAFGVKGYSKTAKVELIGKLTEAMKEFWNVE